MDMTNSKGDSIGEPLLRLDEIADRWKVCTATPRRAIEAGLLPAINLGLGRRRACWRVRLADVIAYERARALSTGNSGAAGLLPAVPGHQS
jgi:uncharacterized protein (DUF2237 family)